MVTFEMLPPRPVSPSEAESVAREVFGLDGTATPLPGEYDANFRFVTAAGDGFVLKIMHPDRASALVELQAAAMDHLAAREPDLPLPRLRLTHQGERHGVARLPDGTTRLTWMLGWLNGRPLADIRPRHGTALTTLGRLLARMDIALADFDHSGARRELKWDLTRAGWIRDHLDGVVDPGRRALVERCLAEYDARITPALSGLRRSVIHGDANDYNVLVDTLRGSAPEAVSVIDFGDMHHGPLVCELAVAAAYAVLDTEDPLAAAARLVAGYHAVLPLTDDEIALIVPLLCMRLSVSVINSAARRNSGHDDPYVSVSERPAWEAMERLAALPPRLAHYTLRAACGLPPVPHAPRVVDWLARRPAPIVAVLGVDPGTVSPMVFDLSFGSPELGANPNALDASALTERLFGLMDAAGSSVGIGRYDEARPIYTASLFGSDLSPLAERRTIHMGVDLFAAAGTSVHAARAGKVHAQAYNPAPQDYGGVILLCHTTDAGDPCYSLYGHLSADSVAHLSVGTAVEAGQRIGRLGVTAENGGWTPHLHFQLITDLLELDTDFPGVVRASERPVWRSLSPDPAPLLGLEGVAPAAVDAATLQARRQDLIGRNVRLSYQEPVAIVRGWRQYLYDDTGRAYLDVYNNVPLVGHSHPHVVAAVQRQTALLNTNTRYLHDNLLRYAERLVAKMPESLQVCYVLNSASEANELALRLARAHTRRRDVIVLEHAYHGHTTTLIDISPYKFNGPGGSGCPPWVHVAPIPDDYRGEFRRNVPDRGSRYAAQVGALLARVAERTAGVGAFIAETLPSVGGQVELPAGYLQDVYRLVRLAGGVCVADEVQVGFGRLGSHFWGFETQGVTPDIVVLGKPIGNGFPLAAVVTTAAIAESFDDGMEFFSTFGGNPVACAAGLAVLDVLESEQLMDNAHHVGGSLKIQLTALSDRHAMIGDVRGRGLFLGVELVRDRETREPASEEASYVVNRLRQLGVLCGTDGPHHNVLKIRPPLCLSKADVDHFTGVLDLVLAEDPVRVGLA